MSTEHVPSSPQEPTPSWLVRLGLSGKLLGIGSLAGILVAFLPLVSVSVQMGGPGGSNPFGMPGMPGMMGQANQPAMSINQTAMVIDDWRGKVGLAGYLAALVLAFVLYPPNGLAQKTLCWAGVGAGLLVSVLAIWMMVLVLNNGSSSNMMGMGSVSATVGIGAYLNVVAGIAVAIGGFLKARDEKLV